LIQFWKLGWRRLHTRERYYRDSDGVWHTDWAAPLRGVTD
jgi:pyridoxine/pyridoxamine 5'-phosphate oxidase